MSNFCCRKMIIFCAFICGMHSWCGSKQQAQTCEKFIFYLTFHIIPYYFILQKYRYQDGWSWKFWVYGAVVIIGKSNQHWSLYDSIFFAWKKPNTNLPHIWISLHMLQVRMKTTRKQLISLFREVFNCIYFGLTEKLWTSLQSFASTKDWREKNKFVKLNWLAEREYFRKGRMGGVYKGELFFSSFLDELEHLEHF